MVRRRMRSDAPIFTDADYDFIMQRRDERPRQKVLNDLTEKYGTSTNRIYQIWRGEEVNRIAWDQPLDLDRAKQSSPNFNGNVDLCMGLRNEDVGPSPFDLLPRKTGRKKKAAVTDNLVRIESEIEDVLNELDKRTVINSQPDNSLRQ